MPTLRELAILDSYLDEPEPRDWEREEEIEAERADMYYDDMMYERICNRG